ncbi:barstar family protein [Nocardia sp. NPDC059177]|uniref:barstar family protein n=1 Tax=Nocardia sp. NPDC059177 TaxID=3346759 RepID=UPI0036B879BC
MTSRMPLSQFLARPAAADAPAAPRPVFGALAVDAAQFSGVRYDAPADYRVRELRGPKMRTVAALFDEFAAAFQFPYYFGANKDAFDECLRDLDDFVGDAPGYVAVIRSAAELLAHQPTERGWFVGAVEDCAAYWARRDVVFRVVLQGEPGAVGGAVALIDRPIP